MDANRTLEARVSALESSLRRSRRVALLLGVALALVTSRLPRARKSFVSADQRRAK